MAELIKDCEDIQRSIKLFSTFEHYGTPDQRMKEIIQKLKEISHRAKFNPRDLQGYDWPYFYLYLGSWAIQILGNAFNTNNFCELLLAKNRMYGPGPILTWGNIGIAIRLHSKIERYTNLKDKGINEQGFEPLVETLTDVVGYCVLGMNYCERFMELDNEY